VVYWSWVETRGVKTDAKVNLGSLRGVAKKPWRFLPCPRPVFRPFSSVTPPGLTNTGTAAVTLSSGSVSGAGFTLTDLSLPLTLAAGQSTPFSLTLDPEKTGTFSGTVALTSDAPHHHRISLRFRGESTLCEFMWTASRSKGVIGYDVYRGVVSGGPVYGGQQLAGPRNQLHG
jgi:hypothetical protein